MAERKKIRACAVFQLRADADMKRIAQDAPRLMGLVQSFAVDGPPQLLVRSPEGHVFGWLFETKAPLGMIQAEIDKSPAFVNGDGVVIFEIGQEFGGMGLTRAGAWLQHHPARS